MNIRVALAQLNPTVGDFKGNTAKIVDFILKAEKLRVDLVVFPELSLCGYPVWDLAHRTAFVIQNKKSLREVVKATRGKKINAVVGYVAQANARKSKNFNALAVISNGKIVATQFKILLPTYDVFLEEIFFAPGKIKKPVLIGKTKAGLMICEDLWDDDYSVKPGKALSAQGAEVLVNLSASPYSLQGVKARFDLMQRKAKEYGTWLVYVNQVGGQDDLLFDGRSAVIHPSGSVVYVAPAFKEGLFVTTIDSKQKPKRVNPFHNMMREQDMYRSLAMGLRDYIRKNGFKHVVLGLSGGIDSALVAALAVDALGSEQVVGVAMPGPFSTGHSLTDARALASALKMELREQPISTKFEQFMKETEQGSVKGQVSLAEENLQARLRGLTLMYISNKEGALLLTTGNKSELAMGYSTLYGDMCGGLSVIGDVYKTDVYRLAHYRNRQGKVISDSTLKKSPSAELRPNQKDEDSLPPYSVLDPILQRYIERNEDAQTIISKLRPKGISEALIRKVLAQVDHNEYKRRQLPPALRTTDKAWFGRRMPITNAFKA
jgi:NAD+ synthase (glutamine-hydrolysing)